MKMWKVYRRTDRQTDRRTDGRTDRQTTDDRWSEKLTWAFSSGKLKTCKTHRLSFLNCFFFHLAHNYVGHIYYRDFMYFLWMKSDMQTCSIKAYFNLIRLYSIVCFFIYVCWSILFVVYENIVRVLKMQNLFFQIHFNILLWQILFCPLFSTSSYVRILQTRASPCELYLHITYIIKALINSGLNMMLPKLRN